MRLSKLTSSTLLLLSAVLINACMAEQSQDNSSLATPISECGKINASETLLWNSNIAPNLSSASFILVWSNASSKLEMALSSPSGVKFNSSAQQPIVYGTTEGTIYYIVPDPEAGNWTATITAKDVPVTGQGYCGIIDLSTDEDLSQMEPISEEALDDDECQECNKSR